MKHVELRTIKNGMFSKFNEACEGKDIVSAMQKIEQNKALAAAQKDVLNMLIEKGILIVLKGDEEEFDKNAVYTFVYSKGASPVNTVPTLYNQNLIFRFLSLKTERLPT